MISAGSTRANVKPRHAFISVEGTRLHWAELGEPASNRVPLVLLHGLNDSHLTWTRAALALSTDRRVLMPDLPGYGLSERPNASYTLRWHANVMAKWLQAIGLDSVDLVGHSFGGGVAQEMLLECPTRIRRLVLVASGGLGRQVAPVLRLAATPHVVEQFGQRFMALGTRMAIGGNGAEFSREDVLALCAMNGTPGSARAFARTVRDVIDWRGQRRTFFQRAHELTELPAIAVCWGDRDPIIPAAHGQAFAAFVEGVELRQFDGCGHFPHRQEPTVFARTVRDFLDDTAIPRARLRPPTVALPTEKRRRMSWMTSLLDEAARARATGANTLDSCLGFWRQNARRAKDASTGEMSRSSAA
jgi:pimeloyl-ACP methyl ester carboxylesterase